MKWQDIKAFLSALLDLLTLPDNHMEPELKPIPIEAEPRRPDQRRY